jgi:chromosome segregation ATPase
MAAELRSRSAKFDEEIGKGAVLIAQIQSELSEMDEAAALIQSRGTLVRNGFEEYNRMLKERNTLIVELAYKIDEQKTLIAKSTDKMAELKTSLNNIKSENKRLKRAIRSTKRTFSELNIPEEGSGDDDDDGNDDSTERND